MDLDPVREPEFPLPSGGEGQGKGVRISCKIPGHSARKPPQPHPLSPKGRGGLNALSFGFALAFFLLFALGGQARCDDRTELEGKLDPLIKAHKGKVALALKHLRTSETYLLHADEVMPTASLIKLAVMVEVYHQVAEGKIKLTDPITLRKEDMVQGAGVLTYHITPGVTLPLRDVMRLMIAHSDNTATNLVLDKIGIGSTGEYMEKLGFPNTKINAKVFKGSTTSIAPERTKKYGLGSTTAREMITLLEKLHNGEVVSPTACKEMVEILRRCEDNEKFPRFLGDKVSVAHKTGSVSNARTDAGILYWPSGPVVLCVLTDENADQRYAVDNAGNVLCANIARGVVDYFSARVPPPSKEPKKKP